MSYTDPEISPISLSAVQIEVFCQPQFASDEPNKLMGCGSGFFFKKEGKIFLITNWHVMYGHNFDTGTPLTGDDILEPNLLRLH